MSHTLWYIIGGVVVVIAFLAVQWYYNQSTPKAVEQPVEYARIGQQFKQDGDVVAVGDQLIEVETGEATILIESKSAGILEWLVRTGQQTEIGSTLANISDGVNDVAVVLPKS